MPLGATMISSSWMPSPLKLLPQPVTAVALGVILNAFFNHYPELKERLQEMEGKIFHFDVEDLYQSFYMVVDPEGLVRIHTYSDDPPHVTMAGSSEAFLSLLFGSSDPDSLFFSRQLKLSGETDTGLRFKNLLDNVDIDWEEELSRLVGTPAAMLAAALVKELRARKEKAKQNAVKGMDAYMARQGIRRKQDLESFRGKVEQVAEELERLERTVSRLGKKLAARGANLPD